MITKNSLDLLQKMISIEYESFVINRKGTLGTLSKLSRIQECFQGILTYIETRKNSIFTICNERNSMSLTVSNLENGISTNDHTRHFVVTIANSAETYMVEEVIYHEMPTKRVVIKYDESKK